MNDIPRRPEGHLPVGASLVVRTGHERIPHLIVAATMLSPETASPTTATALCTRSCGRPNRTRKSAGRSSRQDAALASGSRRSIRAEEP